MNTSDTTTKRKPANARVTAFVNADNKQCFCVTVVNEAFMPHPDEGRVLGHYNNAKEAQIRASIYNNEGI